MLKKLLSITALLVVLISCSKVDNNFVIDTGEQEEPTETVTPNAVDDTYNVSKNEALILSDLLDNDVDVEEASIEVITTGLEGSIANNSDGSYTYTPSNNFTGTDSFQYQLCSASASEDCTTATVTITVVDTETPTAVNDAYDASKDEDLIISNLLDNDLGVDENTTFEIISTDLQGSIANNADGSYTYTPSENFTGTDSFQYQLCSASASEDCTIATVTITVIDTQTGTFNIPAELYDYYSTVTFTTDADVLHDELHDLTTTTHTNILSYSKRHPYLLKADEDLTNSSNVILMYTGESRNKSYRQTSGSYSGKFNTEHVYPQSLYKGGETVKGDLHHLRYCDGALNTSRSNRTYVSGSGDAGIVGGEYYPGDEWKGDVARMILYLNVRYDESIETMGDLSLFLQWNVEDPISNLEIQRNDVIEDAQGNRNPFIDNPYLVTLIWGGTNAENKWK